MREKDSGKGGQQSGPLRCSEILIGALQEMGLGRAIGHLALLQAWDRAIAPRVRKRATVEDLRGGRLYLCAEDPIWLHELHMLRHTLKTLLNQELGEAVVQEIVLKIGSPSQRVATHTPAARPQSQRPSTFPDREMERINQLLSPLKDLPCRDALERLLHRWASRSI